MTWLEIINELGGGLQGLLLGGAGFIIWQFWRKINELQDKRIEDMQRYNDALRDLGQDSVAAVTAATAAVEALTQEVRNG